MDNRRNYYRILHVQPDAPGAIIKASYRVLMQNLKLHPDLGGDEWNAAVLNEAYATLSNSTKRAIYDTHLNRDSKIEYAENNNPAAKLEEQSIPAELGNEHTLKCDFCSTDIPNDTHHHDARDCAGCDSPLNSSTRHLHSTYSSGRALERQLNNAPVKYFTEAKKPPKFGVLCDLSPLGLQFQLSEPLKNEQVIKLVCDAVTAIVKVKNCREAMEQGLYVVGAEFITSRFNERRGTFFSADVC